ncbi:hypothetical protein L596_018920 [Steinernema carpocapsae]|uniref:EH domain-containing protein n=1 Tax=Steinernema carpocapsae TaxID=34508 RepID=A0A4U5N7D3_STECR|nr:hypothetical protein L596_018920 [Steinernema carpocapsae]
MAFVVDLGGNELPQVGSEILEFGHRNVSMNAGYGGNIPVASFNGNGGTLGGHGVIPPTLLEENRVPKFYKDLIVSCGASTSSQLPNTALVYNLMVTSQLSRETLGNIWSLVNRSLPGQLTRSEFYSCLALIALAQV